MDFLFAFIGAGAYAALEWFTGITATLKKMLAGPPPPPPPQK